MVATNSFTQNSAGIQDGAVFTSDNGSLTFNGTNNFINNSASKSGAIYVAINVSLSFIGTNNCTHNSTVINGGTVLTAGNGVLTFNGINKFINNSTNDGAICAVTNISLIFIGTNNIIHNL